MKILLWTLKADAQNLKWFPLEIQHFVIIIMFRSIQRTITVDTEITKLYGEFSKCLRESFKSAEALQFSIKKMNV